MKNNTIYGLNFEYSLLEYYKKLSLDEKEVMVLFSIKHLLEQKNGLITADLLAIKMNLSTDEIDSILVNLLSKKFIEFKKSQKGLITSLKPLEVKLCELYALEIGEEIKNKKDIENQKLSKKIYSCFEKELKRTLSPVEMTLIDEWINNGISETMIIDSLHDAIKKKRTSLKAVEKIILTSLAREDLDSEGITTISKGWNKNISKTIEIANKTLENK